MKVWPLNPSLELHLKAGFGRRMLVTLLLGFASGLPLALSGVTLKAWYTHAGINLAAIGALSLIGQPYIFKFLWAPIFDRFHLGWLDKRRDWILLTQLLLAAAIASMAWLSPNTSPLLLCSIALMVAFFSASQDTNIDAYRAELLYEEERGLGSTMLVTGYRIAALVSGGLAIALAAEFGWHTVYLFMAILMLLSVIVTLKAPAPSKQNTVYPAFFKTIVAALREFLNRPYAIATIIFIVLYKISEALTISMSMPFLLRYLHFSLVDVGLLYKTVGLVATLLGAVIGGVWMLRINLYKALLYFGIGQALSSLAFMVLALVGKNYAMLVTAVFLENFCSSLATIAFMAFLMALCDTRFTATQYALFSALAAIGRVFVGPIAGVMLFYMTWASFYLWACLLGVPSILLLLWLQPARR